MENEFDEELKARVRMGRLSMQDAETMQVLFTRWRSRRRTWHGFPNHRHRRHEVMLHRVKTIRREPITKGNGRQAVFKVVAAVTSVERVQTLLDYLAQDKRHHEELSFIDEFGEERSRQDSEAWLRQRLQLTTNDQAESDRQKDEGVATTSPARRSRVLVYHLVLSMNTDQSDPDVVAVRFARAVEQALDTAFVDEAFPLLWVMHDDCPCHLHAHVVLSAVSLYGTRMRFDRAGDHVDWIRLRFAKALSFQGIEHAATRREDRDDVLREVLCGQARLRSIPPVDDRAGDTAILPDLFPVWFDISGRGNGRPSTTFVDAAAERPSGIMKDADVPSALSKGRQRLFGRKTTIPAKLKSVTLPGLQPVLNACRLVYRNDEAALNTIRAVIGGDGSNRSLVIWHLTRCPEAYGELLYDGYAIRRDLEELGRVLRETPVETLTMEEGQPFRPVTQRGTGSGKRRLQMSCRDSLSCRTSSSGSDGRRSSGQPRRPGRAIDCSSGPSAIVCRKRQPAGWSPASGDALIEQRLISMRAERPPLFP